jgi:ABC-type proline/glycine betaine transport system ATPase subunit
LPLVPQLLGWSAERTATRVDELLAMFDLPPAPYRCARMRCLAGSSSRWGWHGRWLATWRCCC